jgi:hypothetical protein
MMDLALYSIGLKPERDQVDVIHLWRRVNLQQYPLKVNP